MPPELFDFLTTILSTLSHPDSNDPILECPLSTRFILQPRPASLIELAHTKIHSYAFSKVPACWRRLFTDASVVKAVRVIKDGIGRSEKREGSRVKGGVGGEENGSGEPGDKRKQCDKVSRRVEDDWIQEAVRLLDMAVIVAGAPEREEMIGELLSALQAYVEDLESVPPKKKRKKESGGFPTEGKNVPKIHFPIPMRSAVSMEAFEKHIETGQPMLISNALRHWPALHERPWKNPGYLLKKTFGGRRLVPVEIGRSYTDYGWGQSIITFKEFMDEYLIPDSLISGEGGEGVCSRSIAYLAQHDLLTQIPSLRADISIPDFCYTNPPPPATGTPLASKSPQPKLGEPLLNAWFGPAGTVSPLHTDPYHNILCQVVGKKYVRLYSPEESGHLYPKPADPFSGVDMSNTSEVDVEAVDENPKRFPLFKEARFVECVLEEGECLYVPVGWWHYVSSLSVSFSISFWWN